MTRNRKMPGSQAGFYYGNVMTDAIGPKHGIREKQLERLLDSLPGKAC
jgi:hypothetical protein